MRRFAVSLAILVVILWGADRVVGTGMDALFRTSQSEEDGDTFRRAIAYRAPIIVCGSSRAQDHYEVDSLETWLGAGAYNLGRGGSSGPLYEYGAAGIVLRHYVPRLWIMEVDSEIDTTPEKLDRLSCFLPYVDEEPAAAEVVGLRSRYEPIRLLSKTYRYNSLVLSLLAPRLGKGVHHRNGFIALSGALVPGVVAQEPAADSNQGAMLEQPAEDSLKMRYLRKTVSALQSRGVVVVAVRSPHYLDSPQAMQKDRREEEHLSHLFRGLGVSYLDFSPLKQPEFGPARLYRDSWHLNVEGATLFTHALADSLDNMRIALRP